jgi:hypothetical protein
MVQVLGEKAFICDGEGGVQAEIGGGLQLLIDKERAMGLVYFR